MDIAALEARLDDLAALAREELAAASHLEEAIQIKNRYLGRKGQVADLMKLIRELPNDQKPLAGQAVNARKGAIEQAFEAAHASLKQAAMLARIARETLDVTLPARPAPARQGHPMRQVQQELVDIFLDMGFEVADGPEVEEDFYNFESLNFPPDHPARDMQDTFMLSDGRLLRTHTSPVQIRTMLSYEPPIRIISPGRTYRVDADSTHSPNFHQVEGLLVDKNVTFSDLKGTLRYFVDRCFGPGTPVQFRPSYFPFTEPSAEVDVGWKLGGSGNCPVEGYDGWLEIMGCGMVDPNVLENCGLDPDVYTGFAFGMGVERIAMLRIELGRIGPIFENDLRFLKQFG